MNREKKPALCACIAVLSAKARRCLASAIDPLVLLVFQTLTSLLYFRLVEKSQKTLFFLSIIYSTSVEILFLFFVSKYRNNIISFSDISIHKIYYDVLYAIRFRSQASSPHLTSRALHDYMFVVRETWFANRYIKQKIFSRKKF